MFKRIAILAIAATFSASAAFASGGEGKPLKHEHWHFAGPFGTYDKAAAQRGFQVYKEICSNCHSMKYVAIYNLGDKGAPFFDPEHPNPNDNPKIKAIAKMFTVQDGPDEYGDMFDRPGTTADKFPSPYANDMAAKASNGGALPPDLSLIIRARHHGPDYVYSLLTGYEDPPAHMHLSAGMNYNPYFVGGNQIGMPPPLFDDMVEYTDGTPATVDQMARDVVEFLTWASDPKMEQRHRTGWAVLIYLFFLSLLLYGSYRAIWRDVEH